MLIELLDVVVHMDVSASAHAGLLVTDKAANVACDFGLTFQAIAKERVLLGVEGAYLVSYEKRTSSSIASGPLLGLSLGLLF
jgi:hypothetical protein